MAPAFLASPYMRPFLLAIGLLFTACSSSSSEATTADGATDTSSDGATGCITPVQGATCKETDVLCAGFEGGCCAGFLWTCDPARGWNRSGLGCPCTTDAGSDTRSDASDAD